MAPPNYISPDGARRLQEELKQLLTVERVKVVQEVADAAAQGDRSENAEYIYGKKRLREIDRRIRFLGKRLDGAVIVERSAGGDQVLFGATVEVSDEDGQRKSYTLVGPDEAVPAEGRISFQSPMGRALMKKRVGDIATVQRPAGEIELEVVSIRYD
jgi:transcription elongation factor GreB